MKKLYIYIILVLAGCGSAASQTVTGRVFDAHTNEPVVGVNVIYQIRGEAAKGTVTAPDGSYSINIPAGGIELVFSYLGYEDQKIPLIVGPREILEKNVYLVVGTNLLEEVVVSAGRYQQRLSEITVSMEVIKKNDLLNQSPTDLSAVLNTLPAVDINDKQPSIRGGSGWTYGVGARSLILVDGLSILNPGTGEINWNTIPMENIDQVEVIKGASSVLYGSSALNGLINIRTTRPNVNPETRVNLYSGIYGDPANEDYKWWDSGFWKEGKYEVEPFLRRSILSGVRNPLYEGLDVSHSRRIGDFDVSGGVNLFADEGYREYGYNKRFRIGGNVTYHQPGINEMNYGANINFMSNQYGDFFIWRSPKEPYRPSSFTKMGREGNTLRVDPFFNFSNPAKNSSHKVRGRFFYRGDNIVMTNNSASLLEILGNTGTDAGAVIDLVGDIADGDYSSLYPLVPPLLEGDINGLVDGALGLLGGIFPNGTTSDLSDAIAWFMNNGLPASSAQIVPWLSQTMYGDAGKTLVDKFYTYYLDYQYSKKIGNAQITTGGTFDHGQTKSVTTGNHNSDNVAFFFQYDQRFWNRLSVSLGMRTEYYRVDKYYREAETKFFGTSVPVKPIFRAGINYQLATYTFIRASFGQGYRYPSLTEKYARRDIGGVGVFPNEDVKAEKGMSAEIGIKQGYKFGRFQGIFDMAGFFTQYDDMIEFRFGLFDQNDVYVNSVSQLMNMILQGNRPGIGAQFYNVSKARISGLDISTTGVYDINHTMKMNYNLGYVFIQPVDVDYKSKNDRENLYTDPLQMKEKSNNSKYLKYRQKHTVKGTFDLEWKRLTIGANLTWKSKTLAVDYFMVDERQKDFDRYEVMDYVRDILFGNIDGNSLNSYWERKNKGYFVMDLRTGIKVTKAVQFKFTVNNLFNKEYCTRPMALAAPRTFVTQLNLTF